MNEDLVSRLRQFGDSYGLDNDAADEISRLRIALQLAVGELSTYNDHQFVPPDMLYQMFLNKADNFPQEEQK
jgi:hypothetical protein